jgi:hypothetical protein
LPLDEITLANPRTAEQVIYKVASGTKGPRATSAGHPYLFKHSLVRDAAYGTLLRQTRRALHARIAETLQSQFADVAERQPELLARHCSEAGLIEKAAALWGRAGQRSLERSALVEATEQLARALTQIATLPATPALRREQVKLQVALITPLMHVKGYAAPETKAAAERARVLIEQAEALGEPPDDPLLLFSILYSFWTTSFVAFKGDALRELASQFLALAEKQRASVPLMIGHRMMGSVLHTGAFAEGRAQEQQMPHDLAFALAGLGGFNAHGAGFLAAADKAGVVPDIVTATSGQILVVADWLLNKDLRAGLIDPERESNPFAQISTALFGYPGVFRPAYSDGLARFFKPPESGDSLIDFFADRFLPAQEYVPTRSDKLLARIASVLNGGHKNGSDVGIVFNAYDPFRGEGFLYGNDTARALLPGSKALPRAPSSPNALYHQSGEFEATILPITVDAIKSALWLSLYGFDGLPNGQMDGAYYRSCIVSELHPFATVIVARPLANGWIGRRPGNWFDIQDWQCEMWFSVGYKAEVEGLKRINDLIMHGYLKQPNFKLIRLIEIEPPTPAGYFNFFVERDQVYDAAYAAAANVFTSLQAEQKADTGPSA